jgi:hypothetical protein
MICNTARGVGTTKFAVLAALFCGSMLTTWGVDSAEALPSYTLHASACEPTCGMLGEASCSNLEPANTWGYGWRGTTHLGQFTCPFTQTDLFPKANADLIVVRGQDNNSQFDGHASAFACVAFVSSNGGACGATVETTGVGWFSLNPPLTAWKAASNADFAYVQVRLPVSTGTPSRFKGIYIQDQ